MIDFYCGRLTAGGKVFVYLFPIFSFFYWGYLRKWGSNHRFTENAWWLKNMLWFVPWFQIAKTRGQLCLL
jgi:hypothetical protein